MIVHDFYIIGVGGLPAKYDTPLGIDPNAVKSAEIALEQFQSVSRRHAKVIQLGSGIQKVQFAQCAVKDLGGISSNLSARSAVKQGRGGAISEGHNHVEMLTRSVNVCNSKFDCLTVPGIRKGAVDLGNPPPSCAGVFGTQFRVLGARGSR